MARIPHVGGTNSTFGNRGPDRPTQFNPDTSGMDAPARALQGLAATVGGVAQDYGQQQQREAMQQRAENEALARAKASNALLDDEIETQTVVEDVQSRIATGDLDWRKADEEFNTAMDEREVRTVEGLAPDDNERYQGGVKRNRFQASARIRGITDGAKRVEFKGQFDASLDKLGKLAGMPGADIEKINAQAAAFTDLARQAEVDPAVIAAKLQVFNDTNWTNQAKSRLMQAQDNPEALKQLEHDLTAADGYYVDKLDTDKRNAVWSQTLTAQTRLEAKTQHEETKKEAGAERAIAAYDKQIATGVPAPPEFYTDLAEAVKGTSQEAAFQQRIKDEIEVRQVMRKPPAEQRAYLQELQAAQTRDGATVEQQEHQKRTASMIENNLKLLKESPLVHNANTTGTPVQPLDMGSLLSGDTRTVSTQIAERMVTLQAMRKQYGPDAGTVPLLPQEASSLASALSQASPSNAAKMLGVLNTVMSDPDAYRAAMQQIAPDAPVAAYAGQIQSLPGGEKTAFLMLQGQGLLKAKEGAPKFPMPPDSKFEALLSETAGNAYQGRPEDYKRDLAAVRAVYAATMADNGDVAAGVEFNDTLGAAAISAVVGDVAEYGDVEVIPPWGMPAETFVEKADHLVEVALKTAGVKDRGGVSLMATARPGLYILSSGITPLYDPTRKTRNGDPAALFIDFNARPPLEPVPAKESSARAKAMGF